MVDVAWAMVVESSFTWNRCYTFVPMLYMGTSVFIRAHSTGLMTNPLSSFG